ncbi:glycosyltransferase [Cytobacillus firmus]|uniref:glycosyltransferase family 2 protein n=1 Tax=Cytobacillus firmus TaxID=1399 RepID=UPI00218C89DB|nr:glycosyltransferase family 2 protein [Cytobacillus firmus]URM33463.1 glycosyltransferase [Cytobacillus firmus]
MNAQPKISIITACYNSEKTIEQTIQSVLNQTYENIEYIIVDGASTDGTMEIVKKYHDRISLVVSEKDSGVYDAFNKGVQYACGDYILFLNSDDYLIENTVLKYVANQIELRSNPIGVYGDIYIKNETTGFIRRLGQQIDLSNIKNGKMPPHPATFLQKSVITEFEGFNLNYQIAADFELLTKIFMKYEKDIYHIPILVSVFRLGGLSSNIKTLQIVKEETKSIINEYLLHFDSNTNMHVNNSNENYLKLWIENIVFNKKSISDPLKKLQIKNVVIFGSGELAVLIAQDLIVNEFNVLSFLDNNSERQGITMNGICVYSLIG